MNPEQTSPDDEPYGLHAGFLRSARRYAERPALEVDGQVFSYAQLQTQALAVANALRAGLPSDAPQRVGVLGFRSQPVYGGLLGTLMAGCAAVPLNPGFPSERTKQMMDLAGIAALLVDTKGQALLDTLLAAPTTPLLVILGSAEAALEHAARWPAHRFMALDATTPQPVAAVAAVAAITPDSLAYLFFTSGSTGVPKGVGVLHRNAARFVEMSLERYSADGLDHSDRFSQFYDITFDSSMMDLYVCWALGACLCVPTAIEWVNPNKFIDNKHITAIDIVPSTGHAMNRAGGWRPGRFDKLRLCRFGGEALSAELAAAMAAAAPAALIDNVYGPTECTVDAAYYRWNTATSATECVHGVVPIGVAGPQVGLLVVDADLREVPVGGEGELLISGPQVTPGYWQSPQKTAASFVQLPGSSVVHYRTGDLVRRPADGGPIPYLGRLDYQIKISGVRIELGEVEQALRDAAGTELAVAVGWPPTTSGASGIVAFVVTAAEGFSASAIRYKLKTTLPAVMVPKDIHWLAEMPLNVNGKVDRKALLERLKAGNNNAA